MKTRVFARIPAPWPGYYLLTEAQILETRKSADTRKALRFFAERGWKTHFVDLAQRPLSRGELHHFLERLGVDYLIDRQGSRFRDLGPAAAPPGDERWIERLLAEPLLLRQPLVRAQNRFSVGDAEADWREGVRK